MQAPPREIARSFGADFEPLRLNGGLSSAWRAGGIVLKPAPIEADWLAETFAALPDCDAVRFPRPVRSDRGRWVERGHVAWVYLDGITQPRLFTETLAAGDALHAALAPLPRPAILDDRDDPWARADRIAWGECRADYAPAFQALIDPLIAEFAPVASSAGLIHGDLTGNVLVADGLPPAVIDLTLYWRPPDFAKAIVLADLVWFGSEPSVAKAFAGIPDLRQMFLRAAVRRIAEQPEQVQARGKEARGALEIAQAISRWTAGVLAVIGTG